MYRIVNPDSEPVAVGVRGAGGDVSDFIFACSDFDRFSFVAIDENIVAKSTESEHESAQAVKGKKQHCGEAGSELGSLAEVDEL